ncbi:ROK family protein [Enterococcus durans]|uniref:ROK family protein n=1 Tax=Enterococcus durans TaxID=53345 RepID=UPI0023308C2F|nr:ROK family protein [Enterococcus durans]MDB1653352.1 ROK family protein [Enterococcus durans]MDB1656664.1 ROK family protein [Enterococcus durans]MDB1663702.1 ROK family protein [Enterococcus durans]MDB1669057.1 ROK family protein [Enterococcus durans]MDB1672435.1 ROK family protein [Enterococcus durans]
MKTLSIDIGGTFIKTAVVFDGQLINKKSVATPKNLPDLTQLFQEIIQSYHQETAYERIAVAVPGAVSETGKVAFGGAIAYLDQVNLIQLIQPFFSDEIVIENDAKAAVLGEWKKGNLRKTKNAAAVVLGTGVGLGIILNGEVYQGTHRQAGEVSFFIRDREIAGTDSFAGMGLSAVVLIHRLAKLLDVPADGKEVFRQLKKTEHTEAQELFNSYCHGVAVLCFNLQTILDLEKIVIGGGISQQEIVITTIRLYYEKLFRTAPVIEQTLRKIPIECTAFKSAANLIGIAEVSR